MDEGQVSYTAGQGLRWPAAVAGAAPAGAAVEHGVAAGGAGFGTGTVFLGGVQQQLSLGCTVSSSHHLGSPAPHTAVPMSWPYDLF